MSAGIYTYIPTWKYHSVLLFSRLQPFCSLGAQRKQSIAVQEAERQRRLAAAKEHETYGRNFLNREGCDWKLRHTIHWSSGENTLTSKEKLDSRKETRVAAGCWFWSLPFSGSLLPDSAHLGCREGTSKLTSRSSSLLDELVRQLFSNEFVQLPS